MLSVVNVRAPAKVNIGLRVFPRRRDGFHNIESIFQTVSFYDDINVKRLPEENVCRISCQQLELPAENTLTAAYNAICRLTGRYDGMQVTLTKRIPAGGGLGGGSSDAAAFVKAFAMLTSVSLTDDIADAVAAEVGSDVFFFMHATDTVSAAIVSGRGEIVKAIAPRTDLYFLLVMPEVHSSTKEAYVLVDELFPEESDVRYPLLSELECMYQRPVKDWSFVNTFTPALERKYSAIADALVDVRKSGAVWADMTGSGAVVVGVYESEVSAARAYDLLQEKRWRCVLTR